MNNTQIKTEILLRSDVENAIIKGLSEGWSVVAMWDINTEHNENEVIKTVITFGKMPIIITPHPEIL